MNPTSITTPPSTTPMGRLDNLLIRALGHEACRDEMRYRLEKLRGCLAIADGKFFIKTPKAHEELGNCIEIAERLCDHLGGNGDGEFAIVTDLETRFNDLLKKTYEFRIKAG